MIQRNQQCAIHNLQSSSSSLSEGIVWTFSRGNLDVLLGFNHTSQESQLVHQEMKHWHASLCCLVLGKDIYMLFIGGSHHSSAECSNLTGQTWSSPQGVKEIHDGMWCSSMQTGLNISTVLFIYFIVAHPEVFHSSVLASFCLWLKHLLYLVLQCVYQWPSARSITSHIMKWKADASCIPCVHCFIVYSDECWNPGSPQTKIKAGRHVVSEAWSYHQNAHNPPETRSSCGHFIVVWIRVYH